MKINREKMKYRIALFTMGRWEEVAAGWNYGWAEYILNNLPPYDTTGHTYAIFEKGTDKILYRTDQKEG